MNRLRRMGRQPEQTEHDADLGAAQALEEREAHLMDADALPENAYQGDAATSPDEEAAQVPQAAMPEVTDNAVSDEGASTPEPSAVEQDTVTAQDTSAVAAPDVTQDEIGTHPLDAVIANLPPERTPEPGATAPLSDREELTALPANAVVSGKYVVQSQLHHGADRNLYRVGARKQQKCPSCGRLSSADASDCEHCAAKLENQSPADFYLMAESFYPQALMQDPALMDLRLYHPNIVPVVDFFSYTPFGKPRYYAVAEPRQGVRLSQMSMPRPGPQVFGWALQLADALDYLHSKGVVGAGAEADDILVQGDMASLASLQNAHVAEVDSPERTQLQNMDLAKLAATIYEAYAGQPAAMSPEGMLPMPSQAPDKVTQALRAAIEPVQGIAPPITAAQWRDMLSAALLAITELEQPGRPVDFVAADLSDVGRVREQNQDSFSVTEFVQSSVERPMKVGLYVVADGMGGHKGGEIASSIASQVFSAEVMARVIAPLAGGQGSGQATLTNEAILQGMARAVQSANERIYKARDSRQNDMGTTLVAVLIAGGKAYIVNVGDSRFYFYTERPKEQSSRPMIVDGTAPLKGGTTPLDRSASLEDADLASRVRQSQEYSLNQVSVDHSLVHRLVELGQLDPEEAKVHPHRNFIYRSLGGPPPIEVDTFVRTLHPGDRLLLCSDGLNSMIEDAQIEEVLASEQDPHLVCQQLVELANEAGGHDNITAIVIDVTGYMPVHEQ